MVDRFNCASGRTITSLLLYQPGQPPPLRRTGALVGALRGAGGSNRYGNSPKGGRGRGNYVLASLLHSQVPVATNQPSSRYCVW